MTGLVWIAVAGSLIALGLTLGAVYLFVPVRVDAAATLDALAPPRSLAPPTEAGTAPSGTTQRLGTWAQRALPDVAWWRVPYRDLDLLAVPVTWFYGRKIVAALAGALVPVMGAVLLSLIGLPAPGALAALGVVAAGGLGFLAPHVDVASAAKVARAEFRRELASWVDAVAVERVSGAGVLQAMERAASVGDHWVWRRLSEEVARSRWAGSAAWNAFADLAVELDVPELADAATVLQLAGEEGTAAWESLRARAAALRQTLITDEQASANADVERMTIPATLLACVFVTMLIAPALLSIFTRT